MIVPGYIINSLFGIGNIPVIGNVISEILTGGKGGGIIAIRYEYYKKPFEKEGIFSTSKVSAFVPSTIQNLFY
jgi:Na+/citrate or Na+/malate symporter